MSKKRIVVYGKTGCDKCKILNQRIDKLLTQPEWAGFEKQYVDVETEEGIVTFCEAECVNPQRIPAMVVMQPDASGEYQLVPNRTPGQADAVCGKSRLYQYLGLQTDYSAAGQGVITPKMITTILEEARV